jgi:hypothetical protein
VNSLSHKGQSDSGQIDGCFDGHSSSVINSETIRRVMEDSESDWTQRPLKTIGRNVAQFGGEFKGHRSQ